MFKDMLSFNGRIHRLGYWAYGFVVPAFIFVCCYLYFIFFGNTDGDLNDLIMSLIPAFIMGIFACWMSLVAGIKRWHDLNKSGWFMLLNILPYIGILDIWGQCKNSF